MTVRPARADEAGALTVIARAAKASWGYPAAWLSAWEEALTITADAIRRDTFLVAELGERVVGLVALEARGDDAGEITHLWVDPEIHGRGVGRALFDAALLEASARRWTSLRIESDPNAVPFYERLGATVVGTVAAPVLEVERRLPVMLVTVAGGSPPRASANGPE